MRPLIKCTSNGCLLFVFDYVKAYRKRYPTVEDATSEGARLWKDMGRDWKAPWLWLGNKASEQYKSRRVKKKPSSAANATESGAASTPTGEKSTKKPTANKKKSTKKETAKFTVKSKTGRVYNMHMHINESNEK